MNGCSKNGMDDKAEGWVVSSESCGFLSIGEFMLLFCYWYGLNFCFLPRFLQTHQNSIVLMAVGAERFLNEHLFGDKKAALDAY